VDARPQDGSRPDAGLRTIEPSALRALLDGHGRWFESGGSEGARADLSRTDLARADLSGARLSGAILAGARLKGADLRGADLVDADLAGANLQGADLTGADLRRSRLRGAILRDARLCDADLTGASGVLTGQLGGADLSGTRLPDDVGKFDGLVNVTEASRTTQGLFFSILFICAYTWMTVASTRDAQLLNNAAPPASRLPILGTDIPLVQFYLVAPLLLLCVFTYFHLCLQRLWEELGELPAVFPDGRALDQRAYPWLLNGLVRVHAPRLRERRSPLSRWQARVSILLAWGLVPLTLVIVWGRYLRAHDWLVTLAQVVLIGLAVGAGFGFRRLAAATLLGAERRAFRWRRAWQDARARGVLAAGAATVAFAVLSFGAIEGFNPVVEHRADVKVAAPAWQQAVDLRFWVPRLFQAVGYNPFAQLDEANLSTKPASWAGGHEPRELESVHGADLGGRNLRYALAYDAFFVNAYLKGADARGCDLRAADLRGADLRSADLRGTNFRDAKLQKADLRWANLAGAKLRNDQLQEAQLVEADLTQANLVGADLTGADLRGAILVGADLTGAKFDGADLAGADLTGATGLTAEQLHAAKLDSRTRLPVELRALTVRTSMESDRASRR
jgi:uncharacterized protein YjbI with pentapeptide repeats